MPSRREFLKTTAGAGMLSCLADSGALMVLNSTSAADTRVTPDIVQLNASIEPIVRLIENTPREKCFEMITEQLRGGLPYRQFLAALYLAGIRNVNPQPPGFKFHCVFVIHAAHQISLDAPVRDRLLPLYWALDNFKISQQRDVKEGDFRLQPVRGRLPSPEQAWDEFHAGMTDWDEERADRAIVVLVRSRGSHEIIESLWRYGARDYRNIGHKAIFVANTWRTLQTIGWQHAEPALRSLVLGLLDFGKSERVNEYAFADQSFLPNADRAAANLKLMPGDWTARRENAAASRMVLDIIRTGKFDQASSGVITGLQKGEFQSQAVWDAAHLAAGELMMQQPGIYGIHTVTSLSGLHYAYQSSRSSETRLLLLLQALGWMCQFRNFMASRPKGLRKLKITDVRPAKTAADSNAAIESIFAAVGNDPDTAAARALSFARRHPQLKEFAATARKLIFRKGTDAHDYKYATSIFEDYEKVSPVWRPHMLATAVYHLRGNSQPDSPIMTRAKAAIDRL